MKKYDWDKLFTLGEEKAKYFKWVADPIVNATVVGDDETIERVSHLSAIDMAIGEQVTKNKHILTGVAIGVVGTVVMSKINKEIKKRKKVKVEIIKEDGKLKIRVNQEVMDKLDKYRKNK